MKKRKEKKMEKNRNIKKYRKKWEKNYRIMPNKRPGRF